ncbi:hypothetical protein PMAYCL1PPCAC_17132, partial [Pristionchus mayeri]
AMPPLGSSKKSARACLVCCSSTSASRMGLDVCRACSVFYKRSADNRPKICRSGTNGCLPGKGLNCKKCRLRLLELAIKKS